MELPSGQKAAQLIQGAEILGIVGAVAAIVYIGYKAFNKLADPNTTANKPDSNGNYSGGALEHIANNVATIGEAPITYTEASKQLLLHPWDSLKSIWSD